MTQNRAEAPKRRKNVDRVRGTYEKDEEYMQYFGGEARGKDLGVEGKMILKLKLQKWGPYRPWGPPSLP
jgi:hypothetical protein